MIDYHQMVTGESVRDDEQLFAASGDGANSADHRVFGPVNGIYFVEATMLPVDSFAVDALVTGQFVVEEQLEDNSWSRVFILPIQLCLDMPNHKFKKMWPRIDSGVGFEAGKGRRKLRAYCDFLTPVGKHAQYFAQWMVAYD